MRAQYCTLEASVERAGRALACAYSGAEDFEAAVIRARRQPRAFSGPSLITQMQIVVGATALAAVAMLVVLVV